MVLTFIVNILIFSLFIFRNMIGGLKPPSMADNDEDLDAYTLTMMLEAINLERFMDCRIILLLASYAFLTHHSRGSLMGSAWSSRFLAPLFPRVYAPMYAMYGATTGLNVGFAWRIRVR